MPSISRNSHSNNNLVKEYTQLLGSKKKTSIFSCVSAQPKQLLCLHCGQKSCQHLQQIINSAALARKEGKPYAQCPDFTFTLSGRFTFLKALTKGAYGQLFLLRHAPTGRLMVAKVQSLAEAFNTSDALSSFLREREALLYINSPGVIKLFYSFRSEYFLYQVMEYAAGGDVSSWISGERSDSEILTVLVGLIAAVQAVHRGGFLHGDIKLENILLTAEGRVCLGDFGLSEREGVDRVERERVEREGVDRVERERVERERTKQDRTISTIKTTSTIKTISTATKGTPDYMAPEQLLYKQKDFRSDWWSVGVCAWELMNPEHLPPFYAANPQHILEAISGYGGWHELAGRAPGSAAYKELLGGLLQPDPSHRLTFKDWKNIAPLTSKLQGDPFAIRNERYSALKAYNLKVLESERVMGVRDHLEDARQRGMFPSAECHAEATKIFPICKLYN